MPHPSETCHFSEHNTMKTFRRREDLYMSDLKSWGRKSLAAYISHSTSTQEEQLFWLVKDLLLLPEIEPVTVFLSIANNFTD
jgi:hypothetical protein